MGLFNIILGLFFIGLGFLVKAAPNLISGYNTMSKEKKENVDIEGLSSLMRNGLVIIGVAIIVGHFLFTWAGLKAFAGFSILVAVFSILPVLMVKAQKYDHNKNKNKWVGLVVLISAGLFTGSLITFSMLPSKMEMKDGNLKLSGIYGFSLGQSEIADIELRDTIPAIRMRLNGVSIGSVHKGYFRLETYAKCRLFLHSDEPPYIVITDNKGFKTIINFRSAAETREVYGIIENEAGRPD
jgi:hypothetical protein